MPTHDRVAGRKITASWTRHCICIAEVKSRHSVLYCTVLCCTALLTSGSDDHSSSAVQRVRDMFVFITYCSSTTSTARHGWCVPRHYITWTVPGEAILHNIIYCMCPTVRYIRLNPSSYTTALVVSIFSCIAILSDQKRDCSFVFPFLLVAPVCS